MEPQDHPQSGNPGEGSFKDQVAAHLNSDTPAPAPAGAPVAVEPTPAPTASPVAPAEPAAGAAIPPTEPAPQPVESTQGDVREASPGNYEIYVKTDGRGQWLPAKEAADDHSFQRHNTIRAQELAERERNLDRKEANISAGGGEYFDRFVGGDGVVEVAPPTEEDFQRDPAGSAKRLVDIEVAGLRNEVKELKSSNTQNQLQTARERGIEKLKGNIPGFDAGLVEAELSRMPDDEARRYDGIVGYECLWHRIKSRQAGQPEPIPAPAPPAGGGPPASVRGAGPASPPGGGARPAEGPVSSLDDIAARVRGLKSFQETPVGR